VSASVSIFGLIRENTHTHTRGRTHTHTHTHTHTLSTLCGAMRVAVCVFLVCVALRVALRIKMCAVLRNAGAPSALVRVMHFDAV